MYTSYLYLWAAVIAGEQMWHQYQWDLLADWGSLRWLPASFCTQTNTCDRKHWSSASPLQRPSSSVSCLGLMLVLPPPSLFMSAAQLEQEGVSVSWSKLSVASSKNQNASMWLGPCGVTYGTHLCSLWSEPGTRCTSQRGLELANKRPKSGVNSAILNWCSCIILRTLQMHHCHTPASRLNMIIWESSQ